MACQMEDAQFEQKSIIFSGNETEYRASGRKLTFEGFYAVTGAAPGTYTHNNGTIVVVSGGDGSAAWLYQKVTEDPEGGSATGEGSQSEFGEMR